MDKSPRKNWLKQNGHIKSEQEPLAITKNSVENIPKDPFVTVYQAEKFKENLFCKECNSQDCIVKT